MYFGFERMWTLSFVPLGFAAVTIGSLALGCVYFVGATKGGRAAMAFTRVCSWTLLVALAGIIGFAAVSGQWAVFMRWYGVGPMFEMGLLAFMWAATMWLMAVSYSRGRIRDDDAARSAAVTMPPAKDAAGTGD